MLSVSRLVASARLALERLGVVWVAGELSNCKRAASGHLYFTLKDANAEVDCVMWRSKAQHADFALRNGLAVEVRALPSIYEPRGTMRQFLSSTSGSPLPCGFDQLALAGTRFISS